MKKRILKLFSLLLMIPSVVYADEIGPVISAPNGSTQTPDKDFTVVFVSILAIVVIIVFVTILKNKKGK